MTVDVFDLINACFYLALIVLVIVLIVLGIRTIQTLGKVEKMVDDISRKSSKLDGVFNIIDGATDMVAGFSDSIVNAVTNGVDFIVNRKKGKKKDE